MQPTWRLVPVINGTLIHHHRPHCTLHMPAATNKFRKINDLEHLFFMIDRDPGSNDKVFDYETSRGTVDTWKGKGSFVQACRRRDNLINSVRSESSNQTMRQCVQLSLHNILALFTRNVMNKNHSFDEAAMNCPDFVFLSTDPPENKQPLMAT